MAPGPRHSTPRNIVIRRHSIAETVEDSVDVAPHRYSRAGDGPERPSALV